MAHKTTYKLLITTILVLVFFVAGLSANSQSKHPGYGSLIFKYSWVDDISIPVFGVEGGVYVNQRFPIGISAFRSENINNFLLNTADTLFYDMKFKHIDLTGGVIGRDNGNAIRFGVHLSAGLGTTTFSRENNSVDKSSLILEPGFRVYHELFNKVTIAVGGAYRWSSISNQTEPFSADINGFALEVVLRFGTF